MPRPAKKIDVDTVVKAVKPLPRLRARKAILPRTLNDQLRLKLTKELRGQGHNLETFDPDFIVGVVMEFLSENDAVLTATGVRRYKRDR